MSGRKVGHVSEEQRNEIQRLFERKNSLVELLPVIDPINQSLYEKVVADMSETNGKFQRWWDDRAKEYNWEKADDGNWEIDFETCDVFLLT